MKTNHWFARTLLIALCVVPLSGWAHDRDDDRRDTLRVMTQNLYLGADLLRVVNEPNPQLIPVRVAETLGIVNATDFPARAKRIAQEIDRAQPDVVALQEVTLLRTQFPGDVLLGNPVQATDVLYDYLDLLMAALDARGLHYRVAASVTNADVEVPSHAGTDAQGNPLFMDVRLTDHDVILVNRGVRTHNPVAANYATNLQLNLGGLPVEFTRGYAAVDARIDGRSYRIVNTHLELPGPAPVIWIQALQAQELAATFSYSPLPVVLLGDFNSTPEDPIDRSGAVPPYLQLTASHYADAWLYRVGPPDAGYTCCQDELLNNADSALFMRIDYAFVRAPDGDPMVLDDAVVRSWLVGDTERSKTRSGLWPSDHAGVVTDIGWRPAPVRRAAFGE
jgi:endonuclease/exonuclease/phosphatase family metal-dependent hydrolase